MNFIKKAVDFVGRPTHTRTMGVLIVFILAAVVSLTVAVSQQQQNLRQQASNNSNCILDLKWDNFGAPPYTVKYISGPLSLDESPKGFFGSDTTYKILNVQKGFYTFEIKDLDGKKQTEAYETSCSESGNDTPKSGIGMPCSTKNLALCVRQGLICGDFDLFGNGKCIASGENSSDNFTQPTSVPQSDENRCAVKFDWSSSTQISKGPYNVKFNQSQSGYQLQIPNSPYDKTDMSFSNVSSGWYSITVCGAGDLATCSPVFGTADCSGSSSTAQPTQTPIPCTLGDDNVDEDGNGDGYNETCVDRYGIFRAECAGTKATVYTCESDLCTISQNNCSPNSCEVLTNGQPVCKISASTPANTPAPTKKTVGQSCDLYSKCENSLVCTDFNEEDGFGICAQKVSATDLKPPDQCVFDKKIGDLNIIRFNQQRSKWLELKANKQCEDIDSDFYTWLNVWAAELNK